MKIILTYCNLSQTVLVQFTKTKVSKSHQWTMLSMSNMGRDIRIGFFFLKRFMIINVSRSCWLPNNVLVSISSRKSHHFRQARLFFTSLKETNKVCNKWTVHSALLQFREMFFFLRIKTTSLFSFKANHYTIKSNNFGSLI